MVTEPTDTSPLFLVGNNGWARRRNVNTKKRMNIINRCLVHCPVIHSHFLFSSHRPAVFGAQLCLTRSQTVLCLPLICHPRRSASGISNFAICDNITSTPRTYTLLARLYINHALAFLKPESRNTTQRIPSVECISHSSII